MLRSTKILLTTLALSLGVSSCDKSDSGAQAAPAAPAMPSAWKVVADQTYDHDQREFLEIEGRLKGRLKAVRVTTYEVNGHRVQLNTIVPKNSMEGDKAFRILANKKKPWSYVRKDEIIYEFVGPAEAEKEIMAAHEALSR